jgi:hypothetical protein
MEHQDGKFSLWSVLLIATAVASASAGASWEVGRSRMEDELEQYRRSVDLGLPEALRAMTELSGQLKTGLEEREKLQAIPGLQTENAALKKQLAATEQAFAEAKKALAEAQGETFILSRSKARVVVPGKLAVGVDNIGNDLCHVWLGKVKDWLSPGEFIEAEESDRKYRVLLLEAEADKSCRFSLSGEAVKRGAPNPAAQPDGQRTDVRRPRG